MNELDKFKKQYLALVKRMTDATYQLVLAGQSKDQILRILASNDFKQTIMNDKEFQKSFDALDAMHVKALKNMKKFADISPSTLQALTMVNKSVFMDKLATDIASTLKGNLTSGILGGLSKSDIIKGIEANLRPDQIDTLVTTALSNYTASVNALMADQMPDNTNYVYVGPTDKKTRDVCLEIMSAGPMTQKQIEERFPSAFIERGGFNCRHQWNMYTKTVQMHDPKGAKALLNG